MSSIKLYVALNRGSIQEVTEDPAVAAIFARRGHKVVGLAAESVDSKALLEKFLPKDAAVMYPVARVGAPVSALPSNLSEGDLNKLAGKIALEMLAHLKAASLPVPELPPLPVIPPPKVDQVQ